MPKSDSAPQAQADAPALKSAIEWAKQKKAPLWMFQGADSIAKWKLDDNSGGYRECSEADFDAAVASLLAIVSR